MGKTMANSMTSREIKGQALDVLVIKRAKAVKVWRPFWGVSLHKLSIGGGVTIGGNCEIVGGGGVTIEDYAWIGGGVWLLTVVGEEKNDSRPIHIKAGAKIGAGATVLPGVTIGMDDVVQAGSVISRNVGDFCFSDGTVYESAIKEPIAEEWGTGQRKWDGTKEKHFYVKAGKVFMEIVDGEDSHFNRFYLRDTKCHTWLKVEDGYAQHPYVSGFEELREISYDDSNEMIIASWKARFSRCYFYWKNFQIITGVLKNGCFWHEWNEKEHHWSWFDNPRWEERYFDAGYDVVEIDFDEKLYKISNPKGFNGEVITDEMMRNGEYAWVKKAMERTF